MRRYMYRNIMGMLDTIEEMQTFLMCDGIQGEEREYLILLQDAAIAIGELLETAKDDTEGIIHELENYCEDIYEYGKTQGISLKKQFLTQMSRKIAMIREKIVIEVSKDNLEVVFLPYKADMWTSFSSIWESAQADPDCNVKVVPIPYYDIGDIEHITLNYEGNRFPQEVEITSFRRYNLEQHHPDIIFIHNPYDDRNNLTRVPKMYFSDQLKKHTDKLVYSPYFTVGTYKQGGSDFLFDEPGVFESDYVIAQSEKVKELFVQYGKPEEEILSFGSPKIDAVIKKLKTGNTVVPEWENKIKGKKVFLLNTHLSYFPKAYMYANSSDNYGVRFHKKILDTFLNHTECALIWRPHPLLKNMLQSRFPECLEFVEDFERRIRESDNGIVDQSGDYFNAFACSDAMISTWSSLINEYMVTGKPVLIFQKPMDKEVEAMAPLNRNTNYFAVGQGRISFAQFRDNVLHEIDPQYESRKIAVQCAFANCDGTAGSKIYHYLKEMF